MRDNITRFLVDRLLQNAMAPGCWGYARGGPVAAEPTAIAALALHGVAPHSADVTAALAWVESQQRSDGSVSAAQGVAEATWATSLCLLSWVACRRAGALGASDDGFARRATSWLLRAAGRPANVRTHAHQHDSTLVGWSWVAGTHSWIEPTAYAVLALRAAGHDDHPRVREGVRLVLDRALPQGGWNYGNSVVLDNALRPFPETTGVALTALAPEPRNDAIDRATDYLHRELPRIRSPLALGWGLVGLTACARRPAAANEWLAEAVDRNRHRPVNCLHDALLLLAAQGHPVVMAPDAEVTR